MATRAKKDEDEAVGFVAPGGSLFKTEDPDEDPDRADKGYTGIDPVYAGKGAEDFYDPIPGEHPDQESVNRNLADLDAGESDEAKAEKKAEEQQSAPTPPSPPQS